MQISRLTIKRDRDSVGYRMYGDVDHLADAVLTKDAHTQYDRNHPFFRIMLQSDLISKIFLFDLALNTKISTVF